MIDFPTQLKIQAYLDGQLSATESGDIATLISSNPEAAALHAELTSIRNALSGAELEYRVPDTRDFYWSRISREISRAGQDGTVPSSPYMRRLLTGWLKPLGAVCMAAIVGVLAWHQVAQSTPEQGIVTALMDAESITFQNDNTGVTFVWFTYPAENVVANSAESNTLN